MKLTDSSFQMAVRWGGLVLMLSTVGNVYLLLRHREVYRDASRAEQEMMVLALKQQVLDGVVREFASHAATDPNVAAILQRHTAAQSATNGAATGKTPAVKR